MEDRSRRRARLVLIVGLLFAVGAGATTFFIANTAKSEAPAAIPTSSIVVAAREIPPKTQITAADLKLVKMNSEVVPPAALTSAEDVIGRITITSISVGEPATAAHLRHGDQLGACPREDAITSRTPTSPDARAKGRRDKSPDAPPRKADASPPPP